MRVVYAVVLVGLAAAWSPRLSAQPSRAHGAPVASQRVAEGRVRRPVSAGSDSTGMTPVANVWVTLHRVGKDTSGPADSVRSDAAGRYRVQWRPFGASDALYFAAVTWGGIAYFTAPLRSAIAVADEAEITVFDTTSRIFPLTIKGRHVIVGAVDTNDTRTVIEVFELSNDSLRTLVSLERPTPLPTWSIDVPLAARDVRVTQGEVTPDAFRSTPGRVLIFAPIAPGLKQVAFSYRLPAASFPINIRADHGAVVFEVLLEETQGRALGGGLVAVDPVTIETRTFRRFLAQDVKNGSTITLELSTTRTLGRAVYVAGVLVAIGFVLLLVYNRRRQELVVALADAQATANGAR